MFSAAVFTDCENITDLIAETGHAHYISEESGDQNDDELTTPEAEGSARFLPPKSEGMET